MSVFIAKKMKCPVCGSKLNTGSTRFAVVTPSNPKRSEQPYDERFNIQVFYCTKSDSHNFFAILGRVKEED